MTQPTEADIRAACLEAEIDPDVYCDGGFRPAVRSAIRALARRIAAEREAVPVAWAYVNPDDECEQIDWGPSELAKMAGDPGITPLYAHPPKEPNT